MLRLLAVASTFTSRSSPQQDLIQFLCKSIILIESGLKSVLPNVLLTCTRLEEIITKYLEWAAGTLRFMFRPYCTPGEP